MANLSDLDTVLDSLKVSSDFSRHDRITEDDILARLDEWKGKTHLGLARLREIILTGNLTLRQQAQVVSTAAFFDGEGPWVTARSLDASQGEHCLHLSPMSLKCQWLEILRGFSPPPMALIESILIHEIKPLFLSNPHPSINLSTGRKLPRPAGGPMASQDYYEGQKWKAHPGVEYLVLWCVQQIQVRIRESSILNRFQADFDSGRGLRKALAFDDTTDIDFLR
jgi:Tti2 family